jgi:hypothetical protein
MRFTVNVVDFSTLTQFLVPVSSKHARDQQTTMANVEFVTETSTSNQPRRQFHRVKMPVDEFYKFLTTLNGNINSALLKM